MCMADHINEGLLGCCKSVSHPAPTLGTRLQQKLGYYLFACACKLTDGDIVGEGWSMLSGGGGTVSLVVYHDINCRAKKVTHPAHKLVI